MHTISPHVLEHPDGRILCLPADEEDVTRGLAGFVSEDLASPMAPDGFYPVSCSTRDLDQLGEDAQLYLVL